MIQFNLLPDVKLKYIKARRQKRLAVTTSFFVSLGAIALVAIMLVYVYIIQGSQISGLNKKISESSESIKNKKDQVDDINKVLTVQNQLLSLDGLHAEKPITSRIFDYLAKITPSQVTISKLDVSNTDEAKTIVMQGSTDTLETVNKLVDTLKFTTFKVGEGDDQEEITVFEEVVLTAFSRDRKGASYTITMNYDPIIFASTSDVKNLVVPNDLITTRSELGRPIIQTDTEAADNAPEPVESTSGGNQ